MMWKRAALCAVALCAISACSGSGVDETAASTTYNAVYAGAATLTPISGSTTYLAIPLAAVLTMSQLASTVTGNVAVVDPARGDTLLSAGVTGRTTSDGLDLTILQPLGCATHLSGPLVLGTDGVLRGVLEGSDCHATGQADLRLTLSLSRH